MAVVVISNVEARKRKCVDCYKCVHCKAIPGSAHVMCAYALGDRANDALIQLIAILGGCKVDVPHMKVTLNEVGVKNGWCNFPINFDPVWVVECDKYEEKKEGA